MKLTTTDVLDFRLYLPCAHELDAVIVAVEAVLVTEMIHPHFYEELERGFCGEALGFELKLYPITPDYCLQGHAGTALAAPVLTRGVSLSDFFCSLLNTGPISDWYLHEEDQEEVNERRSWDVQDGGR